MRENESRTDIVDKYRRAWQHADATIAALPIDAGGHVPWWPLPEVKLFNVMVHVLTETNRHAGHADILREQLDDAVMTDPGRRRPVIGLPTGNASTWPPVGPARRRIRRVRVGPETGVDLFAQTGGR